MKIKISILLVFILLLSLITCSFATDNEIKPNKAQENVFDDISESDNFYDAVMWAYENGVTTGVDEHTFAPNSKCTRAEVVTFLYRLSGCPEVEIDTGFLDISEDDWFYSAVLWAYSEGIVNGVSETEFLPKGICRHEEIITMLWRSIGCPEESTLYTDRIKTKWAVESLSWAYNFGLINSFELSEYCPRYEIVQYMYRVANNIKYIDYTKYIASMQYKCLFGLCLSEYQDLDGNYTDNFYFSGTDDKLDMIYTNIQNTNTIFEGPGYRNIGLNVVSKYFSGITFINKIDIEETEENTTDEEIDATDKEDIESNEQEIENIEESDIEQEVIETSTVDLFSIYDSLWSIHYVIYDNYWYMLVPYEREIIEQSTIDVDKAAKDSFLGLKQKENEFGGCIYPVYANYKNGIFTSYYALQNFDELSIYCYNENHSNIVKIITTIRAELPNQMIDSNFSILTQPIVRVEEDLDETD